MGVWGNEPDALSADIAPVLTETRSPQQCMASTVHGITLPYPSKVRSTVVGPQDTPARHLGAMACLVRRGSPPKNNRSLPSTLPWQHLCLEGVGLRAC
jgi:hypothetical protein